MRYALLIFFALLAGCERNSADSPRKAQNMNQIVDRIAKAMEQFDISELDGRLSATPERITEFETEIGATLPKDYREFLLNHAGIRIDAVCPIQEPTPFGTEAMTEFFYGFFDFDHGYNSLSENSDIAEGAPTVIPIACAPFGSQIFLFISGDRKGEVYYFDGQQRVVWPDEQFDKMFSNLSPEIKRYLELRRSGKLPKKPPAFANFYKLADTFTEYLEACRIPDDGDDAG